MTIYISGKITGTNDWQKRFEAAESLLKRIGHKVLNPARIGAEMDANKAWEAFLEVDFHLLDACDAIFMLKGWEDSRGAAAEWGYAKAKGIKVIKEEVM